jgi:ABC-type branched-subunit amino acid transport system substrate-binding protein
VGDEQPDKTTRDAMGFRFDPVKIGFLADLEVGDDYLRRMFVDPFELAFAEGLESGTITRGVEIKVEKAFSLPHHSWTRARDGLRNLVDAGCIGVMGPLISDNSWSLTPFINEWQVPALTWCGTERYHGDYCFNLGNGGCGEEGQMMAAWLHRQGYQKIGVFNEISPNGQEYFDYFRWGCDAFGLQIVGVETITHAPENLEASMARLREANADAIAYMGFGWPTIVMGPIFERMGWDPPRIMTTAFQFCYASDEWMRAMNGWVGIDQFSEDNPLVEPFYQRFEKRFGYRPPTPNTVPLLSYDTARVFVEAIRRAPILTGPGIKTGLERIRWLPSTTGGPRTHIAAAPYDHKMFKGDWLLYRKVEVDRTVPVGLWDPV